MKSNPRIKKNKQAINAKNALISQAVYLSKFNTLKKYVFEAISQKPLNHKTDCIQDKSSFTVFISICDGSKRAKVYHASANILDDAWAKTQSITISNIEKNKLKPIWYKVDIVDNIEKRPFSEMRSMFLSGFYQKFFRKGFSFDADMKMAFLEAEANAYKIYDYTVIPMKASLPGFENVPCINLVQLKKYLEANEVNKDIIEGISIPEDIYFFDCRSFFMDSEGKCYSLFDNSIHCGRRKMDELSKDFVEDILHSSSQYLVRQMKEDRSFIYGYFPSFNKTLTSYNILRHCGTIWSMMCAYDVTADDTLIETINSGLYFMLSQMVDYDGNTSFLVEEKASEIKLGGNGIAIITLAKYIENFGEHNLVDPIYKLANGILHLQNNETGKFTHVLEASDFSVKEEFRTVYYDGESAYALIKAYEITGAKVYLNAARKAIDYFIEKNYIVYKDHWLAYAMNEFTKHVQEEKYFTFALKNAWENRDKIRNQATTYHTYLELLLETYDVYKRMKNESITNDYFNEIDEDEFVEIIKYRALHMLDGYFFPEYAMYMSKPSVILGSFFVRHDEYRARIDDNQHNIDAYAKFHKLIF